VDLAGRIETGIPGSNYWIVAAVLVAVVGLVIWWLRRDD
jgi:Mg2+ and Co2+ transporter CorA